jgi:hypothetical protein
MRASWKTFPLRLSLVLTRAIKACALIPAWFAMSLAVPALLAQAPAPSAQPAAAASPAQAEEQPHASKPGGPHETVKVHGHWVIDVRNPDGSLAQHHEFENALQKSATQAIVALFLGNSVAGGWRVDLIPPKGGDSPCGLASSYCILQPAQFPLPCAEACSSNLTATGAGLSAGGLGGFTLSGWIQANRSGSIGTVWTQVGYCPSGSRSLTTSSPTQCAGGSAGSIATPVFTQATLPATSTMANPCGGKGENSCEITGIQANQMINVSVTITFQ